MKPNKLTLALGLGLSIAVTAVSAQAGPDPNRVWVKFKPGSRANVEAALRQSGGRIHFSFDKLGAFAVTLPPAAIEGIRRNPNVELVEADAPRYALGQSVTYGIDMVQARDVWDANRDGTVDAGAPTGDGVTVCVIDSGVHRNHEDLAGLQYSGGYPAGWDSDSCGHGSHVAGTIAAANNLAGVVGVSPGGVDLHIVQVFNGSNCGWSYSSSLVDAANRCAAAGAKVINMSLGGATASTTERNGFDSLYAQGVLSIAAAGNDGNTQHSYPASYDSVVSVAAVDSSKAHASFSQQTSQVELAAPGVGVLSTVPFVTASVSAGSQSFLAEALEGTFQGQGSGALANGGRCTASNAGWAGRVVLCERGDISFADKVNFVAASGGAAAIIYNNAPGGFSGTLGGTGPAMPAVSVSQEDGQGLLGLGATSATVNTVPSNAGNGYAYYDGTSMATPHVAGVAALVWSANPTWTNAEIRQALAVTAEDRGTAGRDTSYGWGIVQAKAALDYLNGGGGGTGPDPDPVVAKVGNLSVTTARKGKNTTATAIATIVNGSGAPLSGATVSGCFSGPVATCGTATTNGSGQASFKSAGYKTTGTVTFCVNNVTGPNDSFDSTNACRSN